MRRSLAAEKREARVNGQLVGHAARSVRAYGSWPSVGPKSGDGTAGRAKMTGRAGHDGRLSRRRHARSSPRNASRLLRSSYFFTQNLAVLIRKTIRIKDLLNCLPRERGSLRSLAVSGPLGKRKKYGNPYLRAIRPLVHAAIGAFSRVSARNFHV